MKRDVKALWNYIPHPFWSMDQIEWLKYVNELRGEHRNVLSQFPFKWAYAPPDSATSALQFLRDMDVGSDNVSSDSIDRYHDELPTFEELLKNGSVEWAGESSAEPAYGFRMIPEWEPMAGILINWPIFYPPLWETFREMVTAFNHTTTYMRMPEGYLGACILAWLDADGIDVKKVRPIPGPIGDIWARDYSPIYGIDRYTGEAIAHKFAFAAFYSEYREQYKSINKIDDKFTWAEGYRISRNDIMMDGGNLLTNGNGMYIMTRRVLTDNPTIKDLYAKLEAWLGAEQLIIVDEEPGDVLGHICNFKIIGPEKAIVGAIGEDNPPLSRYLNGIRDMFKKLGFDVIDVPTGDNYRHRLPGGDFFDYPGAYSNSLMVNKRLLLPQYDQEGIERMNEEAIDAYKNALQDYEIIPIGATILGNGGGAINCSTKEIPKV